MKQKLQKLKGKVNPKSFFEQEEELKVGAPNPQVEKIRGRRENFKVNEYLKLNRVGISPQERKYLRDQIRNFEIELLTLLDEAVFQTTQITSDFEDDD